MTERMFEDENGYVYPVENGYKVYWEKENLKSDNDITFATFNEAHYYLSSVS